MAQKAAKTLAARNSQRLNQTHLITLFVHGFFLIFRVLTFRSTFFKRSLVLYVLLSAPALAIEFWLERIARPKYRVSDGQVPAELKSPGEDLDASGVTEFCWDVLYWTWGCLGLAAALGDWAWTVWGVIPLYTIYSLYSMYTGARSGMSGLMGQGAGDGSGISTGTSRRQQKLEKRGGQRVQYR